MNFKNPALFVLFLLISLSSYSQLYFQQKLIRVKDDSKMGYDYQFQDYIIDSVKRGIFVYKREDEKSLESLETLLSDSWKQSDMIFLSKEEFDEFRPEKYDVVFSIDYVFRQSYTPRQIDQSTNKTVISGGTEINFIDVWLFATYYDSAVSPISMAEVNLSAEESILVDVVRSDKSKTEILNEIYDHGVFYNWDLALLSSFVGMCSNRVGSVGFTGEAPKGSLSVLKTEKLYISDAVNVHLKRVANKDVEIDNSDKVKKAYKFDCEIVSPEQLNTIATEKQEGYVLYYIRCGEQKKFLIIDLKTDTVLLKLKGKKYKYNLRMKDIKKIRKAINNA